MIQSSVNKKKQVVSLLEDAYAKRINNLIQSIHLANSALSITREINDRELLGKCLSMLSLFYMIKGEYALSTNTADEAIIYFKETNNEKGIADVKYNLAGIYYKTDNYHLGLTYLIDCLATYRKFNDYHNQSRTQKSLGTIYEYIGDLKNAVKAYEDAIEAARKAGDNNLEANAYNPLSGIYLKQNEVAKAYDIIEKSIKIKEEACDIRGLAFALYGRAKVFTRMKKYDNAENDFKRALEIHESVGERLGTAMAYRKLGAMYIDMPNLEKAKEALDKALKVCDKYNIAIIRFKSNYHLYEIYKREKNIVKSLEYLEKYIKQKEAVINTQTLQVIENYELITKMEALEKDAQLQKEKAEIIEKKNIAEQASKVRQEFLSTMSHEIRTPLNAVITITSLLKEGSDDEERQLVNSLKFASNNLLRIINDILDFTKLDSGKAHLEFRAVNLISLLENLKNTYEGLAREKGLQLLLQIDEGINEAYEIDETKLSQILGNLISNAIKFTESGYVTIAIKKIRQYPSFDQVQFNIEDTGIGIPEIYKDTIFESFSQPQSVTTRKQGGTGLGLAIVKKLVELHGSKIQLHSEVGKGSVFSFELTMKKANIVHKAPVKNLGRLNGKVALLAEDNMINAMVATKLLSNWGIKTEHARNGIEAVEKSKDRVFDFILMDLHMPDMNGFDATLSIRKSDNANVNTPIFALTADITADQHEEYNALFNGFLLKPIEVEKMYEALIKV
jgi:signal transduction histidine kinase/CheY-like chemotaxis protein/Tfp pilus assembly protein PilF